MNKTDLALANELNNEIQELEMIVEDLENKFHQLSITIHQSRGYGRDMLLNDFSRECPDFAPMIIKFYKDKLKKAKEQFEKI